MSKNTEKNASQKKITIDGSEAASYIAYKTNEVIAIYPITPSTPLGEHCDAWQAKGKTNIWGAVPMSRKCNRRRRCQERIHGALQTGALATTFTASQGLLLMIPNMYKIAGELTPAVFHVAARSWPPRHSPFSATIPMSWPRADRFGFPFLLFRPGGHGHVPHRACRHLKARVPFVHFFGRFPHLPRDRQDQASDRRRHPRP